MKSCWLRIALVAALLMGVLAAPGAVQGQSTGYTVPITGAVQSFVGDGGTFEGTLSLTSFELQGDYLVVNGVLDGTLYDAAKSPIGNIRRVTVTLSVDAIQGPCASLILRLGAPDPILSGADISLDPIVLDYTADPGANRLLGNLLCAVARLLDNGGSSTGIVNLLNQVNRVLGG